MFSVLAHVYAHLRACVSDDKVYMYEDTDVLLCRTWLHHSKYMLIYRYLVTCLLFVICRYTGPLLLVYVLLYVDIQVLCYLSTFCYMLIYRSFVTCLLFVIC